MVMVSSVNGKITKGDNPDVRAFSSDEDALLFEKLKKSFSLIIMGRKTYEAAKNRIQLDANTLRIVMTRNPGRYKGVPGQLEFTDESPSALMARFAAYPKGLLVGGGETNALFLKERLVSEIHLTIEPILFGEGMSIVEGFRDIAKLQLVSMKKLNTRGTLHVIYNIV